MITFAPEARTGLSEAAAASEKESKFGRNINAVIEFSRHEEPGKLESGMSADFLTPRGQERAREKGRKITEKTVKDYASPKLRAQETGDLGLQNLPASVRAINRRLEEINAGRGSKGKEPLKFKKGREQKAENEFLMRVRPELDVAKNFAPLMKEASEWAKKEIAGGSSRSVYDLVVQYYLDNPERSKANGTILPKEAAEEIAYAVARELAMTEHFKNDSEVRLRNFTHGPKLEPFLQLVMLKPDGKRGFTSLEEIGGSINPGESFEFKAARDEHGNLTVKLKFRGQEYEVDLENIKALAENYRQRLPKDTIEYKA